MSAVVTADHRVGSVIVTGTRIGVKPEPRWSPLIVVPLPRAVRRFVSAFDAEKFPHLLSPERTRPAGRRGDGGKVPSTQQSG
jgi:hypothetical protein